MGLCSHLLPTREEPGDEKFDNEFNSCFNIIRDTYTDVNIQGMSLKPLRERFNWCHSLLALSNSGYCSTI